MKDCLNINTKTEFYVQSRTQLHSQTCLSLSHLLLLLYKIDLLERKYDNFWWKLCQFVLVHMDIIFLPGAGVPFLICSSVLFLLQEGVHWDVISQYHHCYLTHHCILMQRWPDWLKCYELPWRYTTNKRIKNTKARRKCTRLNFVYKPVITEWRETLAQYALPDLPHHAPAVPLASCWASH